MIRIVKKAYVPVLTPAQAFAQQREQESGSFRLREAVKALLNEGKASTAVVGEVFNLIAVRMEGTGRVTKQDIERVLPAFTTEG